MTSNNLQFTCKICSHSEFAYSAKGLFDDRYGYPGEFNLLKCKNCFHETLAHNFKDSDISDLYSKYYPRGDFEVKTFAPLHFYGGGEGYWLGEKSSAAAWVPPAVSVLDVGCGIGASVAYYKNLGCDAVGIEVDRNVTKIIEAYQLDIRVGLLSEEILKGKKFQYVTLSQVIEHTLDPSSMFKNLNLALEKNGMLVVTFPWAHGWGRFLFRKKWIHWHAPYHIHFFSKKSFASLAQKNGFKILRSENVTHAFWLQYQLMHLILGGSQGQPSSFWKSGPKNRTKFQRVVLRLISVAMRYKLIHLVTRFFDIINRGDNRVVILQKL